MKKRVSRVDDQREDASRRRRFEDLYRANYPAIFRYAFRRLDPGSKMDDAADIAADVFAVAWRRIEKVPGAPDDRLWLYEVARRTLQHHRRSYSRRERLKARLHSDAAVTQSLSSGTTDDDDRVRDAIASLKASDREVFSLVVWEELDNQAAAAGSWMLTEHCRSAPASRACPPA